jgi:very-short-patch-repair endonuclease
MRARAKQLRRAMTLSEQRIWNWLRNRTFDDCKFRRQVPVGPYVLDFYSPAFELANELDGAHHETQWNSEYDSARTSFLHARGIEVVRITNEQLAKDSWTVEEIIRYAISLRG